jgi:coenzyme F420-reducing hydrogenase alpha subunit
MPKTITLNHITKIEGHAKLELGVHKGKVMKCELSATEGSRYFEGLVRGRHYIEAHEMTSRICGICSCAHVIAAINAVEDALGYEPTEQTTSLRMLLLLGERIRSHATHLYFLSLPDYTGYESALAMVPKFKAELKSALRLMKAGNTIIKTLGARDLHPVSATVGGWLKLPTQADLNHLKKQLKLAKIDAIKTCRLFSSLDYPNFKTEGNWFSLRNEGHYAAIEGTFTSQNSSFEKSQYRQFLREYHEARSTSNFVVKDDHRYMVGALARLNNNYTKLNKSAKRMLKLSGIKLPSINPFHNNIAQAIELMQCIEHAMDICENHKLKQEPVPNIKPKAGTGIGVTEAPRGTLWHEYTLDGKGIITKANIITPTTQNLLNIQEDIRQFVPSVVNKKKKEIVMSIEKLIRSYDPCFSCSAHFLEVKWL